MELGSFASPSSPNVRLLPVPGGTPFHDSIDEVKTTALLLNGQLNENCYVLQGNSLFADQMNKSKIGSFPSSSSNLYSFSPPANPAITRPTPASQNSIGSAHSKMPISEPGDVI
jgi:hypothetical protein